ncbi:MAG: beta-L-arabinofuranosidase domain-containing protein, partial [Terracidiphilus sp.]
MDRRHFVKTAALVPLIAGGGSIAWAGIGAEEGAAGSSTLTSHGQLGARYELTLRRVLDGQSPAYSEEFLLADVRPEAVRRFTEFSGDTSGRYIGGLATAARVYGKPFAGLDGLVEKVIALQKPDGYFGSTFHYDKPTDQDLALLWGNGRLLVGLVEYYRLKPSAALLAVCGRLGDWLVRIGPLMLSAEMRAAFGAQHFASSYVCWMQQTEGLANLYAVTKDERYRKLAQQVAAVIERRPGDHVHGYLTSLRGVLDLYTATGDARFLGQCETAWEDVAASKDALITGGVPEGWSPNNHRTEGCGEADWVRLSLALWKATGKLKYLEMGERAVFNELA